MVVCLDNEILEILPLIIDYLKKNADPKDIQDFLPFINQIVAKFKQQATAFLLEVFAPISNCIVKLTFETNFDNADSEVLQEIKDFKKAYYQFLMGIINQDQMNVLLQQDTQTITRVFQCIIHGASIDNYDIQKLCFQLLKKLTHFFVENKENTCINQFIIENMVPCCFSMILRQNIDFNDAQHILLLNEINSCLNLLYRKFGDEFIGFLQNNYLVSLQLSENAIQNLIEVVKSNNPKSYKLLKQLH